MLLPSALSCESSQPPLTRLQSALFASPPASPPQLSAANAFGNIFTTCRSLQSLLTSPATLAAAAPISPPSTSHSQLPTPPLAHAPSPLKLRLRSRKADSAANTGLEHTQIARKRVVKRAPPRGANKRRRALDDDMGRDDDIDSDLEIGDDGESTLITPTEPELPQQPHTPKRARIAPEALPLGLERSDFHALQRNAPPQPSEADGEDVEVEADGERWSTEDDRILVELVLEKLKLSKTEWQDCARSLGKDRHSLGRRWKSLMLQGEVGFRNTRSSRRAKLHGTWRS